MANKLISQLNAGGANLADTDNIEVQYLGEVQTKKITGAQARAVEKAEREAQDNVIEAGCGLNTDGTFTAPANSWSLRAADFAAGCTDRAGATGALNNNIYNALRLLDALVYELGNGTVVILYQNLSADTTLTDVVPAGYMLTTMVFNEKSGNDATLDLGTAAGGNQVFINQIMTASSITTITLNNTFSLSADTTLYLNDDDAGSSWNGATVDVYLIFQPVNAGGAVASVFGTVVLGYYEGAYGFSLPPSDAEITAILGNAADFDGGASFLVNDTLGNIYLMISTGASWAYLGGFGIAV